MDKKNILILLGLLSIFFAYIPVYSKIMPIFGVVTGFIGITLSILFINKLGKKLSTFIIMGICILGTSVSTLMFLFHNWSA